MKRYICAVICVIMLVSAIMPTAYAEEGIVDMIYRLSDLYSAKQNSECIELAESVLAMDDSCMEAYYYMAMAAFRMNDYNLAYQTLKNQLSKNPRNELALYNIACACSVLEKEDECVDYLSRLFSIDASNKSSVEGDSDFDNVRDNEKYKQLMGITVIVGGETVEFDVPPIITDGRTLLPMRKVFECLNAEVSWDDESQTAIAEKDGIKVELTINSTTAVINGVKTELDVPATLMNGRTLVPVRFVSEALNAEVDWDEANRVVYVDFPVPDGDTVLTGIKAALDADAVVSVVDGAFDEPYLMAFTEGMTMIIFKSKETLDLFETLTVEDKTEYIRGTVYDNYALVVGCSAVYAKIIYDGNVYYEGTYNYDANQITGLKYYSQGKPANVVKQYKDELNYKDFYLLPAQEQTTSELSDAVNTGDLPNIIEFKDKDGNVIVCQDHIVSCEAKNVNPGMEWVLNLKLTPEGQERFAEATERVINYVDNYIAIYIFDNLISMPSVQEKIDSDTLVITGSFTEESAKELAETINISLSVYKDLE